MMADILAGGLSSGAIGDQVAGLYGDPAVPYRCAHFFLAIDVAAFRPLAEFGVAAASLLGAIHASRPAAGGPSVRVPGEASRARRGSANCHVAPATADALRDCARRLDCPVPALLN